MPAGLVEKVFAACASGWGSDPRIAELWAAFLEAAARTVLPGLHPPWFDELLPIMHELWNVRAGGCALRTPGHRSRQYVP